jgi:hypothetical protein
MLGTSQDHGFSPRAFLLSYYTMKKWIENKVGKIIIFRELKKLVLQMNLIVDGEVNQQHKRAFKGEYKFTNAFIAAFVLEGRG